MNLADVKRIPLAHKSGRRLGRGIGSGRGKTCGRGHKGAGSRAGAGGRRFYAGGQTPIFLRLPKRGFTNARFRKVYQIVNLADLSRFPPGTRVDAEALHKASLIRDPSDLIKILGQGTLRVPLTVEADQFSTSARTGIEAAGGSVVLRETSARRT